MALIIPGASGMPLKRLALAGASYSGAMEQPPQKNVNERDLDAVTALSLVSRGESRLTRLLQDAETERRLLKDEGSLAAKAREEVQDVLAGTENTDTAQAAGRQLMSSLNAFDIRSRDLALRDRLERCRAGAEQREREVVRSVHALADTVAYSPSVKLRQKALQTAALQMDALRTARRAMELATWRMVSQDEA